MEGDDGEKLDLRLQIPKLNRNDWNSEFKEAFKALALNFGEDIVLVRPEIN